VNTRRLGTVLASAFLLGAAALAGKRKTHSPTPSPLPDNAAAQAPAAQPAAPAPAPAPPASPTPVSEPPAPDLPPGPDEALRGQRRQREPEPQPLAPIIVAPLQPVGLTGRKLAIFGLGLLLGALAVAGGWLLLAPGSAPSVFKPRTGLPALQAVGLAAPEQAQLGACPAQPSVPTAGDKDGRFPLQNDVSGLIAADIGTFIVLGKESAAAGRPRDAEVAFLMSCRLADKLQGADSIGAADARYQLGAHYARLALETQPAGQAGASDRRAHWLAQARQLYADSLRIYVTSYGQEHEKSRFAAQGLASVEQALAQADSARRGATPEPAAASPAAPPPAAVPPAPPKAAAPPRAVEPARPAHESASRPRPSAAAPRPPAPAAELARAAPAAAPRNARAASAWSGPSFDCNRARSAAEVMICSDAELTQLDRELGRVYARAKKATRHPAAFRQRNEAEWRRREATCRDRECLRRWYAHRRNELMNTIEGRE